MMVSIVVVAAMSCKSVVEAKRARKLFIVLILLLTVAKTVLAGELDDACAKCNSHQEPFHNDTTLHLSFLLVDVVCSGLRLVVSSPEFCCL